CELIGDRPPISAHYPYTTLFRSSPPNDTAHAIHQRLSARLARAPTLMLTFSYQRFVTDAEMKRPSGETTWLSHETTPLSTTGGRSEEHTSELQSREKLVCRLLLE